MDSLTAVDWTNIPVKGPTIMAKIKIKQTKSRIGAPKDQKKTLDALGLTKMQRVVEHEDTPSIRGLVRKVQHLVTVIDN